MGTYIYKQSQVAVKHLRNLMGSKIFSNPKDHEVIARIIRYCSGPDDLILDSFAGSGTTAHAVLDLNKEDGGGRKFILVQQPGSIDRARARRWIESRRRGTAVLVYGDGLAYEVDFILEIMS